MLYDSLYIQDKKYTTDGYLAVNARAARSGIQLYKGSEVGKPEMEIVRVLRPEEEVFDANSMISYAHKPITNNHPNVPVNSKNWKEHAFGFSGSDVARDGDFIRVPILLTDENVIADVKSGKVELSCGYDAVLDFTSGKTENGEEYDAIQRGIRINHIAIVDQGRAGKDVKIGDSTTHEPEEIEMQKMIIDGISVEVSETAVQVITKVLDAKNSLEKKMQDTIEEKDGVIAMKDSEIESLKKEKADSEEEMQKKLDEKEGEIEAIKSKIPDQSDIAKLVEEMAALIAKAKEMMGDEYKTEGKDAATIRRDIVSSKLGDKAKSMSDSAIDGAFSVIADNFQKEDPLNKRVKHEDSRSDAYQEYLKDLSSAYAGGNK